MEKLIPILNVDYFYRCWIFSWPCCSAILVHQIYQHQQRILKQIKWLKHLTVLLDLKVGLNRVLPTSLKWFDSSWPIKYPISLQVRDHPTVGNKVFIHSDRLLMYACKMLSLICTYCFMFPRYNYSFFVFLWTLFDTF